MIQIISTIEFVIEPFRGDQSTDLYKIFKTKIDPKQRNDFSMITFLPGRLSLPLPPGFRIPLLHTSPSLSVRTHHCQSPVKNITNITKHYTNDKNITHIKKTLQNIYRNITKQKLSKNIKKHYFIEYILTRCLSSWFEEKILKFKHLANKIYF